MLSRRVIPLIATVLFSCLFGFSSSQAADKNLEKGTKITLGDSIALTSKHFNVKALVKDCETNEPIWGAKVVLDFYREALKSPRVGSWECSGKTEGVTDKQGRVKLKLTVTSCPPRIIMNKNDKKEERLDILFSADGYEPRGMEVTTRNINTCLQKPGFTEWSPPLWIEYPKSDIDYDRFIRIFGEISEINKRKIGEKIGKHSYVAKKYSFLDSKGFVEFIKEIESFSGIHYVPFLKSVIENKYPLPYKRIRYRNEESWKAEDYVYLFGRRAVAKAMINIADDRVDDLLPECTDIPESYLDVLSQAGVEVSMDDYWDYLSERYVSRAHNRLIGDPPRPDPLTFVLAKMKAALSPTPYANFVFRLYEIATINNANEKSKKTYNWQIDKDRLANELFELDFPLFTYEVMKQLLDMQPNSMTRKYLLYLYKKGQYDFLVRTLRENKNLMKAFLAEDVKNSSSWNTETNEQKDLGTEECLIRRMPKVTSQIGESIELYMKEVSINYPFYRWRIRNLSFVNREAAESLAKEIYLKASVEPYKDTFKYEKQYALRGAAEGKLTSLCEDVFDDLRTKEKLRRDYFSVGQARIQYLSSSCPREFEKIVSGFDVNALKQKMKSRSFESSYASDLKNYRDSIWEGVEKYFPKDDAMRILSDYSCGNEELIQGVYMGWNVFPGRYPIRCLCERFERDLPSLNKATVSGLTGYLDKCYPAEKESHERIKMDDWTREIADRTYQGMTFIVKGRRGFASPTPVYDERFRAFFLGSASASNRFKGREDWSRGISSDKAFPLLDRATTSQEDSMRQAGLFAYSFYPAEHTSDIVERLKAHAASKKFPEYLYAVYSLATSNPRERLLQDACTASANFHLKTIEERSLARYESEFAFNLLTTLDLCGKIGDKQNYRRILSVIMKPGAVGRYELFKNDLERIIVANSNMDLGNIILGLFNSNLACEIVLGIRLAELNNFYVLNPSRLKTLLNHDNSYVRLAAAKYIKGKKERFEDLFEGMKSNTNRKVRSLASD